MTRRKWQVIVIGVLLVSIFVGVPVPQTKAQDDVQIQHVVQVGENLFRIALRYGVSVEALATANGITDPTRIYAGQVLVIPTGNALPAVVSPDVTAVAVSAPEAPAPANIPLYHIVAPGENLTRIAEQYGVASAELITWNSIGDPNTIYVGQKLTVGTTDNPNVAAANTAPEVLAPVAVTGETRIHTVQVGERLASISRIYGISWPTIARANNLGNPDQIYAGQQLIIPTQEDGLGGFVTAVSVATAPTPTVTTGKEIMVDLSDQQVFAFENGTLLKRVTVSTGLPGTPTVQGSYKVYWKLTSQTMSGPGYYLPGVPWVMYFYQGYAIHGTYWHNNFGQPMSHGCVNLPSIDAQWFFNWAEVGTPVTVQY